MYLVLVFTFVHVDLEKFKPSVKLVFTNCIDRNENLSKKIIFHCQRKIHFNLIWIPCSPSTSIFIGPQFSFAHAEQNEERKNIFNLFFPFTAFSIVDSYHDRKISFRNSFGSELFCASDVVFVIHCFLLLHTGHRVRREKNIHSHIERVDKAQPTQETRSHYANKIHTKKICIEMWKAREIDWAKQMNGE